MSLTHENVISLSQYNYLLNVRNPFLNSLLASDEMYSRRFFFCFLFFCFFVWLFLFWKMYRVGEVVITANYLKSEVFGRLKELCHEI